MNIDKLTPQQLKARIQNAIFWCEAAIKIASKHSDLVRHTPRLQKEKEFAEEILAMLRDGKSVNEVFESTKRRKSLDSQT